MRKDELCVTGHPEKAPSTAPGAAGFLRKMLQNLPAKPEWLSARSFSTKVTLDEDFWVMIVALSFSLIFSIIGFRDNIGMHHVVYLCSVQILMGVLIGKIRGIRLVDFFSKKMVFYIFLILFINVSARYFVENALKTSLWLSKWISDISVLSAAIDSHETIAKIILGIVIFMVVFGIPYFVASVIDLYCKDRISDLKIEHEKTEAEFQIVSHLSHNLRPKLTSIKSVIGHLHSFLDDKGLLRSYLQKQFYEGQATELVIDAIQKAENDLNQIDNQVRSIRDLITEEIKRDDFESVNIRKLLEEEIVPNHINPGNNFRIHIETKQKCMAKIHRHSFIEAINNLIINANNHGFRNRDFIYDLIFSIRRHRGSVVIDCKNNGLPLPKEITSKNILSYGVKSVDSPGSGLGMAYVSKMLKAHRGDFEIIDDPDFNVHFRMTFPKGEKM